MNFKKWPEGVGVDLTFWDDRDLWTLRDAAAILLGIDPRVFYLFTLDPSFHGGPKLLMHAMPELLAKIEYLSVMANHGTLPAFKGENGWHVRPSDYHAFIEGRVATTSPSTDTIEPSHDHLADGYARPFPKDEAKDYADRLRDKKVHCDEIQYRLYEFRLPRWKMTQWKAHCIANEIHYPPKGTKGEADRDSYGKAYGRAKDRHLASVKASEKSEKVPE